MMNLFTASLTAILMDQSNALSQLPTIIGQSVGVINGSIERHLVLLEGGTPHGNKLFNNSLSGNNVFFEIFAHLNWCQIRRFHLFALYFL